MLNSVFQEMLDYFQAKKARKYFRAQEIQESWDEYLEQIKIDLYTAGVEVGNETFCYVDAEQEFFETDAFERWRQEVIEARNPEEKAMLIQGFDSIRQDWIDEVYVQKIALQKEKLECDCDDLPWWVDVTW